MTTFCLTPTLNVGGNEANDFEVLGFSYTFVTCDTCHIDACHFLCFPEAIMQTGLIHHAHDDLVTDVSYDFYGLRLATCSLDQR